MLNTTVPERIRQTTKQKNIALKTFLEDCGLNRNFMYDLEHGKTLKTMATLTVIANYLGVSIDYLLGRTDNPDINK